MYKTLTLGTSLVLLTMSLTLPALAAPYAIPQPTLKSCSDDRILQELTDNISNGTLSGEENLMASLNFVQSCQDMLYADDAPYKQRSRANQAASATTLHN